MPMGLTGLIVFSDPKEANLMKTEESQLKAQL